MHTNPETLGDIIKYYREKSEYTVEELANKIGISERYLYRIENEGKKPSFDVLNKIIQVLSISPNRIFNTENDCRNDRIRIITQILLRFDDNTLNIVESIVFCLSKHIK